MANLKWLQNPATAVVQNAGNIISTAMHNKAVKDLAKQQNQWNLEQWQRQNAYDSPAAQMQRYVDAGLNPNLVYGSANGNGSVSAPAVSGYEHIAQPQIDLSPMMYSSQMELMKAQARQANANADSTDKLTDLQIKEAFGETAVSAAYIEKMKSDVSVAQATCEKYAKDIELINQQIENMKEEEFSRYLDNMFNAVTFEKRVGIIENEYSMSKDQAESFVRLQNALIADTLASANSKNAQAALDRARKQTEDALRDEEVKLKQSLQGYFDANAKAANSSANYTDTQKAVYDKYGEKLMLSEIWRNNHVVVTSSDSKGWSYGDHGYSTNKSSTRQEVVGNN